MKKLLLIFWLLFGVTIISAQSLPEEKIEGKVKSKQSFWKDGNIFTKNIVEKNDGEVVEILTKGGVVGLEAEVVSDEPSLIIGEKGIFEINQENFLVDFDREAITNSTENITSISPLVTTAGEGNSVTITGENFGDEIGENGLVLFPNANNGGFVWASVPESSILSWSDTQVEVLVPSTAGTGSVRVRNNGGETFSSPILTIKYALLNINFVFEGVQRAYRTRHVGKNESGGYTWQFAENFPEEAKPIFIEMLEKWQCENDMNWVMGEDTDVNVRANDGINIVRFTSAGEVGSNNLGSCTTRYSGCQDEEGNIEWFANELDIQYNIDQPWNYDPDQIFTTQFDFATVTLHELGHGRQLGHVVDNTALMHYSLGNGDDRSELTENDVEGGFSIQDFSLLGTFCDVLPYEAYDCSTLSNPDYEITEFKIYPNPTDGTDIRTNFPYEKTELYNILGKRVGKIEDLQTVGRGLYILKVTSENRIHTLKVIKK